MTGRNEILVSSMLDVMLAHWQREKRKQVESKPLPRRCTLRRLLKGIPRSWLDATVSALGLPRRKRRAEREADVAEQLSDPERLRELLHNCLTEQERELLLVLLLRDGEYKAARVTGRFGSDESDGWSWTERPPASTLGRLRLHGLAFVGQRQQGGRWHRTVVVPQDLVEPLRLISKAATHATATADPDTQ